MEELKVQMEQTHTKLKEESKNRPEETVRTRFILYNKHISINNGTNIKLGQFVTKFGEKNRF